MTAYRIFYGNELANLCIHMVNFVLKSLKCDIDYQWSFILAILLLNHHLKDNNCKDDLRFVCFKIKIQQYSNSLILCSSLQYNFVIQHHFSWTKKRLSTIYRKSWWNCGEPGCPIYRGLRLPRKWSPPNRYPLFLRTRLKRRRIRKIDTWIMVEGALCPTCTWQRCERVVSQHAHDSVMVLWACHSSSDCVCVCVSRTWFNVENYWDFLMLLSDRKQ